MLFHEPAGMGCFPWNSLSLQLAMGKMMEQGPVLIITFQAQVVMVIKNHKGEVVEGDPVSGAWARLGPGTHLGSGALLGSGTCLGSPTAAPAPSHSHLTLLGFLPPFPFPKGAGRAEPSGKQGGSRVESLGEKIPKSAFLAPHTDTERCLHSLKIPRGTPTPGCSSGCVWCSGNNDRERFVEQTPGTSWNALGCGWGCSFPGDSRLSLAHGIPCSQSSWQLLGEVPGAPLFPGVSLQAAPSCPVPQ